MNDDERFRRNPPGRAGPIRNWSTLFKGFVPQGANAPGDAHGPRPNGGNPASPDSVVSRAVELGYQVIEEQIQQGRRAAEQLSDGKIDPGMVTGNMSELAERLLRVSSDVATLWFELIESVVRNPAMSEWFDNVAARENTGGTRSTRSTNGAGGDAAPKPASNGHATVPVEIVSSESTGARVAVELGAHMNYGTLVIGALRTRADDVPPLTDVSFVPASDDWQACIRVAIPPAQSPGTYSGLIINSTTDEPAGTLCVHIPDRPVGRQD